MLHTVSTQLLGPWTEADRRADKRSLALALLLLAASLISRGLTEIAEAARARIPLSDAHVWVLEATSHGALLALAPLIILVLNRAPLASGAWRRSLPPHVAAAVLFSLAHVGLMWPIRLLLFPPIVGYPYTFNLGSPASLGYELTKDVVTYAFMVAGFFANRIIERRGQEARALRKADLAAGRLTLGSGGTTIVVAPRDVIFAKAADNYVEVHAGGPPHLIRMTLAALEDRLCEQCGTHARVHRSYLVNTAQIRSIAPTGEGDVNILLLNGATIPGSRRYRENLAGLEAR